MSGSTDWLPARRRGRLRPPSGAAVMSRVFGRPASVAFTRVSSPCLCFDQVRFGAGRLGESKFADSLSPPNASRLMRGKGEICKLPGFGRNVFDFRHVSLLGGMPIKSLMTR